MRRMGVPVVRRFAAHPDRRDGVWASVVAPRRRSLVQTQYRPPTETVPDLRKRRSRTASLPVCGPHVDQRRPALGILRVSRATPHPVAQLTTGLEARAAGPWAARLNVALRPVFVERQVSAALAHDDHDRIYVGLPPLRSLGSAAPRLPMCPCGGPRRRRRCYEGLARSFRGCAGRRRWRHPRSARSRRGRHQPRWARPRCRGPQAPNWFRNRANDMARSLMEVGTFRPRLHPHCEEPSRCTLIDENWGPQDLVASVRARVACD